MNLPLPESDKDYLRAFDVFPDARAAEHYLYCSWARTQEVLRWLAELQARGMRRLLELGANPYYLTLLLNKYLSFHLELANFFGDDVEGDRGVQEVCSTTGEKHTFEYAHFNIETNRFPYPDDSLDVVVFSEILEHLVRSPDSAVGECRRVLRRGGYLILTTPNFARLGNLIQLAKGQNIADGYSPHGVYGRHNREHTPSEVRELVERHGFVIERSEVRNIYPHPLRSRIIQALRPNVWREHIFVLARWEN